MSIGWGQDKGHTSIREATRMPGEVSGYFNKMLEDIGGGMVTDEDWGRLEKSLYERPAGRLREEMSMMEPRLYSTLAKRGVGDSPEIVAKNVGEAMTPFSRRFADIASGATTERYRMQLPYQLGMGNLWYQGMGTTGYRRQRGTKYDTSGGFGGGGAAGGGFLGGMFGG